MARKKYYAVRHGKTPGIYETWESCKAQVDGVAGAVYKGFPTWEEAAEFMGITSVEKVAMGAAQEAAIHTGPEEAVAYVDGSYNADTQEYSCGVVLFFDGQEIHLSRKGENADMAQMRNVAGEIMGAALAMQEASERGAGELTIFHDYEGIAAWCQGRWKTNKEWTRAYKEYYDTMKNKIRISFKKVKGHSGDKWNDLADQLAKSRIFP